MLIQRRSVRSVGFQVRHCKYEEADRPVPGQTSNLAKRESASTGADRLLTVVGPKPVTGASSRVVPIPSSAAQYGQGSKSEDVETVSSER